MEPGSRRAWRCHSSWAESWPTPRGLAGELRYLRGNRVRRAPVSVRSHARDRAHAPGRCGGREEAPPNLVLLSGRPPLRLRQRHPGRRRCLVDPVPRPPPRHRSRGGGARSASSCLSRRRSARPLSAKFGISTTSRFLLSTLGPARRGCGDPRPRPRPDDRLATVAIVALGLGFGAPYADRVPANRERDRGNPEVGLAWFQGVNLAAIVVTPVVGMALEHGYGELSFILLAAFCALVGLANFTRRAGRGGGLRSPVRRVLPARRLGQRRRCVPSAAITKSSAAPWGRAVGVAFVAKTIDPPSGEYDPFWRIRRAGEKCVTCRRPVPSGFTS